MMRHVPNPKGASRSVLLVVTILILLGSLGTTIALVYYSLTMESQATVSSPPVELQDGTAGNSTIYTNGTSAKVSVEASGAGGTDVEDYVDNNTGDIDNSTDKGTHSNFTAQQFGPDSINDTLTEQNTEPYSEYVWISGDDDSVHKLNRSDLGGTEILSWDTGERQPFGCEFRIEDGNEYIYVVDPSSQADALIKFHANNGTEVTRWDVSGYSGDAWGLAWNGSRWFICDKNDDLIYQVDPADPTVAERSFSYTGIGIAAGLAWDGSYLWVVDFDSHYAYQIDVYGNIQTSWSTATNLTQPTGIAYDTTSGHLWIVGRSSGYLYEYYTNGTAISGWDRSGSDPEGVAYASVEDTYNFELDLEAQWTSVDYDESNEYLCIYGGTMGAENITVAIWNGSDWENISNDLNFGWNNISVSSHLDSSDFTIRFKGGSETDDATQTTWNIDVALLHVWTAGSGGSGDFNYVLNMTEKDGSNWKVRLKAYDNSSITRLDNCSIYIYDGSNSTQIVILNGDYENQTGPWIDLNASDTEYIWMHVETSSAGTSSVYVHLEIRIPDTTTYLQYEITFEIT